MTFFEHQRLARRNTRIMVVLFVLAVVAVVAAVDLALAAIYWWALEEPVPQEVLVFAALATLGVILAASAFNVMRLAGGGAAVARMVGARPVPPDAADPLERRLRNVVEEMAIAAGVRVPEVYVMDHENGINAFAAGWDVSGAVVAVTRGTLETLTRDELQGVVAHEFSHILNGDMRLNIRMIGVLAGIVFIASIGQFVMRVRGEGKSGSALILAGLALFIIGYVGLFFSRLIKSAVARQREFLADASSVQFTRNPDGIAGALDQIGSAGAGTLIANRYAEELSHMFFGPSVKVWLGGLFATHPPLAERIRRVHPTFQRDSYRLRREASVELAAPEGDQAFATIVPPAGRRGVDHGTRWGRSAEESAALVGQLDAGKVDYASRLLKSLPEALREALREPASAAAAMVGLLLAPNAEALRLQVQALELAGLGTLAGLARAAHAHTQSLGLAFHLPVVDLGLAAVKAGPPEVKKELLSALEIVIQADRRVSLHEFVILALVRDQLAPPAKRAPETRTIAELEAEAATVLALVAHAGTRVDPTGDRQATLKGAIRAGAEVIGISEEVPVLTPDAAHAALVALKALEPMQKSVLVKGLFAAVTRDGTIRVAEAGLMRLVGAVLDCPLPPLLESPLLEPS